MTVKEKDQKGSTTPIAGEQITELKNETGMMEKQNINDLDDFLSLLGKTEIMKQVEKSLKEEPVHILGVICKEQEKTGRPVPDYRLHLSGYIGEISIKALLQAGQITQQSGGRVSIYAYSPTEAGLKQYQSLKKAG